MRADAIDVRIGATAIRVLCSDPDGVELLRDALVDHLIDEPAEVGFSLRAPIGTSTFHLLVDRSGFVLARAHSVEECLAVLASHLGALLPAPPGTVRFRARAVLRGDGTAALVGSPLFVGIPAVERRLERRSLRLVDRMIVDIGPDNVLVASPSPWPLFATLPVPNGHERPAARAVPVGTVVVPQLQHEQATRADIVSFLAAATWPGPTLDDRLDAAERLAASALIAVPIHDQSALYEALCS